MRLLTLAELQQFLDHSLIAREFSSNNSNLYPYTGVKSTYWSKKRCKGTQPTSLERDEVILLNFFYCQISQNSKSEKMLVQTFFLALQQSIQIRKRKIKVTMTRWQVMMLWQWKNLKQLFWIRHAVRQPSFCCNSLLVTDPPKVTTTNFNFHPFAGKKGKKGMMIDALQMMLWQ